MGIQSLVMRYLQKLVDRPDLYLVYLPQATKNIYVDIFVKTGRLHESDNKIGIGHLMDHYINGSLYSKYLDRINSNAWISQEHLHFHLNTSHKDAEKDIKRFLAEVFTPKFNNEELFMFERQSIVNEIRSEFASSSSRQFQLLAEHRFLPGSPYRRSTFLEAENVTSLEISDLIDVHRENFVKGNMVIFIAANKPPRSLIKNLFHQVKELKLPDGDGPSYPTHKYSGFKVVAEPENDVAGQQYVSLSWPGLSYENSVEERIALNLFCRILTGLSRHSVFGPLRRCGIYAIDYHNIYYCHFGLVAFWATIPPQRLNQYLEVLTRAIKSFKEKPLSESFLQARLKGVRERTRNAWQNNNDLYNWLMEYILDEGSIRTPKEVFASLKNITPAFFQQVVTKVFDPSTINLVISGEKPSLSDEQLVSLIKNNGENDLPVN